MKSRRVVLGIVAILLAGGCSSSGTAPASPNAGATTIVAPGPTLGLPSVSLEPVPSTTTQPSQPTAPTPAAVPTPAGDVRSVTGAAAFSSPSGRIGCYLASDGVRCDYLLDDKLWTAPRPAGCDLDWGDSLGVSTTAGSVCHGDTVGGSAMLGTDLTTWWRQGDPVASTYGNQQAALPYGSSLRLTPFECASATTGVTCTNTSTGHGFFVSRESYSIF